MARYEGNRGRPVPEGVHDTFREYRKLSAVLADNGDTYMSEKAVSVGIEPSNEVY